MGFGKSLAEFFLIGVGITAGHLLVRYTLSGGNQNQQAPPPQQQQQNYQNYQSGSPQQREYGNFQSYDNLRDRDNNRDFR